MLHIIKKLFFSQTQMYTQLCLMIKNRLLCQRTNCPQRLLGAVGRLVTVTFFFCFPMSSLALLRRPPLLDSSFLLLKITFDMLGPRKQNQRFGAHKEWVSTIRPYVRDLHACYGGAAGVPNRYWGTHIGCQIILCKSLHYFAAYLMAIPIAAYISWMIRSI